MGYKNWSIWYGQQGVGKIKIVKKSIMVSVFLCLGIWGTRKIAASLILGGFS